MPFVQIKLIEGVFNAEQKRQILTKVSDALLTIEGENMRPVTHVIIEEIKSGDWAIGGKSYTADEVKALRDAKKSA